MQQALIEAFRKNIAAALSAIIAAIIAFAFAVIAIVYLWQALAVWLAPQTGAVAALIICAGLALIIAALLMIWLYRSARAQGSGEAKAAAGPDISEPAFQIGLIAAEHLRDTVKENPLKATVTAGVLGLVLGANPRLARAFIDYSKQLTQSNDAPSKPPQREGNL